MFGISGCHGVWSHQHLVCLLGRLFRRTSKKAFKFHVTGHCEGNLPVTGGFPSQRASDAANVSIWLRHRGLGVEVYDFKWQWFWRYYMVERNYLPTCLVKYTTLSSWLNTDPLPPCDAIMRVRGLPMTWSSPIMVVDNWIYQHSVFGIRRQHMPTATLSLCRCAKSCDTHPLYLVVIYWWMLPDCSDDLITLYGFAAVIKQSPLQGVWELKQNILFELESKRIEETISYLYINGYHWIAFYTCVNKK